MTADRGPFIVAGSVRSTWDRIRDLGLVVRRLHVSTDHVDLPALAIMFDCPTVLHAEGLYPGQVVAEVASHG